MPTNAKQVTITYDGTAIGGLVTWNLFQGRPREATFRPLDGTEPVSRPLPPEYGTCVLRLYYDPEDAGQQKLIESLRNRTTATMVITHPETGGGPGPGPGGGSSATDTFTAFCERFPLQGSVNQETPIQSVSVTMRISGYVTHVDP